MSDVALALLDVLIGVGFMAVLVVLGGGLSWVVDKIHFPRIPPRLVRVLAPAIGIPAALYYAYMVGHMLRV